MRLTPIALATLTFLGSFPARAGDPPPAAPSTGDKALIGKYDCSFKQGEYAYKPFKCTITRTDGKLILEKLSGSQRIKGELVPTESGWRFEGVYFCPKGSCDSVARGDFRRVGPRELAGTVTGGGVDEPTEVKLVRR